MIIGSQALPPMAGIRAFLAVAETGSFTRAGQELGLTQTAVSHQIAQLEAWLGGTLFVRERRRVALSPLGQSLLPGIEASVGSLQQLLSQARTTGRRRKLLVTTTPEFATQWLTPRLESFLALYPDISVSLTLEYRRADIAAGEADIAIWLGRGDPRLAAEPLALEEEFVVSSPELSRRLPSRMAITAAPLLHYEGARHTVLDWRRWHSQLFGVEAGTIGAELEGSIDLEAGPRFASFPEMLAACRRGEGFALVRTSLVADDLARGVLVRCFVETLPSDVSYHFVTAPHRRASAEISAFRHWILAQMKER